MSFRSFALFSVLSLAACGGGSENPGSQTIKTNGGVATAMSGHKTYAYDSQAPAPPGDAQWDGAPMAIAEVKQHIDADMQSKGYVLSDNPEMVVRISIGVRKTVQQPTGGAQIGGAPEETEIVTDLAIDVFDHANNGHLFHGTASNQLHHKEPGENKLAKAVRLILEPVPPSAPKAS